MSPRDAGAEVTVDGHVHRVTGAQVALVRDGRVFVQLRPWPPGWELPGGHCGRGEDPAVTARREAEEETGLRVRIGALAGVYTWEGLRRTGDAVYLGEVVGGSTRRSVEAVASRWVTSSDLPRTLFPWFPERITDALAVARGAAPVHRVQPVHLRHVLFFGGAWMGAALDSVRRLRRRRG